MNDEDGMSEDALSDPNALKIMDSVGETVFAILHDKGSHEYPFVMVVVDSIVINCKRDQVEAIMKKCKTILEENVQ